MNPLEIWGGVECTVNRVGASYFNQCEKSGHAHRPEDLALFARLGIRRLRYPFLWETAKDWFDFDRRSAALRDHGLVPIAGLLHHGSGPPDTSLLDPDFPEKFSRYAAEFVKRYAWITDYTPINEPLTTARFSGLYGWWYPHHRSDGSFLRALLNQVRATILAMREIRKVNPAARLIQTDDLGMAQSTPELARQCEFENHRRWLSFDLLCGQVGNDHPLYDYLTGAGITAKELRWFKDNPCHPDILGINHYLLSNRFLDHRLELYDPSLHGGNGLERYVDVAAADSPYVKTPEAEEIYRQAWQRYRLPIAATEIHLRGHRESQMRWFHELFQAACRLRSEEKVDFRAVTAWSLLGAYDWNSLCTEDRKFYEPGAFDLSLGHGKPRPTALAQLIQSVANGQTMDHPLLHQPGWWKKTSSPPSKLTRPVLIAGGKGTLGKAFARICEARDIPCVALARADFDITDSASALRRIEEIRPWAVINAAGYVNVEQAEADRAGCFLNNVTGAGVLAEICRLKRVRLVSFSSDLVFDGSLNESYRESHPVAPLNIYGESKAAAERLILDTYSESLVVRTSSFFGPWDHANFLSQIVRRLTSGERVQVISDVRVSPTYVPDLVHAVLDLLIDSQEGIVHLINEGGVTWSAWARAAVQKRNLDQGLLVDVPLRESGCVARRPLNSVLTSERVKLMPSLDDAMARYFSQTDFNSIYAGV